MGHVRCCYLQDVGGGIQSIDGGPWQVDGQGDGNAARARAYVGDGQWTVARRQGMGVAMAMPNGR